jgi:glutathione synthase/RimK-type ligase-like ATP-grasp enzyme
MIYAIGLDSDSTFIHFLKESFKHDIEIQPINIRAVIQVGDWRISIPDDGNSFVSVLDERIHLDPHGSYFCRIIDLSSVQCNLEEAGLWKNLVIALASWLEHIPGIVINRPGGHAHNFSKPLHEYYLRKWGFRVPDSLTSSNRDNLLEFATKGLTIVKTISGIRANTRLVNVNELEVFQTSTGPVHLQRYIPGLDIRAHAVGPHVHAELIKSDSEDYRKGDCNKFSAFELPDSMITKIVNATTTMGILFAGWDFKVTEQGEYWCLEANPMPGYDGYDRRLYGRITDSLLELLNDSSLNYCRVRTNLLS